MIITCYNCFQKFEDSFGICPHCGHDRAKAHREANHLPRGTMLQERYMIGEVCGFGGFGITYKAWDTQLESIVAIKEYFPNGSVNRIPGTENVVLFSGNRLKEFNFGLERFTEEAKITAKYVSHKNIVNVFNYFEENKTAYIVMEYLDGVSLEQFLQQSGDGLEKLDIDTSLEIALSICNALKTIHADGIIHRDVSPDNIYICFNGTYKLYDFGAARFSQEDRLLTIILKPGYAPPEQYEKVNAQGPWTDIYALGATLYKMVTGVKPVESINRKVNDTLQEPRELEPAISQQLNDTIIKAMAMEPHLRFRNVEEFEAALRCEKKVEPVKKTIFKRKLRRVLSICASVLVLAAGAGAVFWRIQSEKLKPCTIDVWYITDEPAMGEALNSIKAEFAENYEIVNVNLVGISSIEFNRQLRKAQNAGNMPALLQSDTVNTAEFPILPMTEVISDLDLEEYYFLYDNQVQILTQNKMPLGFKAPVLYLNTSLTEYSGNLVRNLSAVMPQEGMLCVDPKMAGVFKEQFGEVSYPLGVTEQFYSGEGAAYFSDTTKFYDIQNYLPARSKMLAIDGTTVEATFCNCWSLGDSQDENEARAAQIFLEYMMNDNAQDHFYIRNKNKALPINRNAFAVYQDIYTDFSAIGAASGSYVFTLT